VGHGVTGGDSAEDVDEDGLDLLIAEDDVETVGHDLGRGAASDVEEVRGLDVVVLLTGVGDDVEGRDDQYRAVADDSDLTVELERVLRADVAQLLVLGVAEVGVVVQGDLAVEGEDVTGTGLDQRVDLDQGGVFVLEDGPQAGQHGGDLRGSLSVEAGGLSDFG